jgi:hypothetical protein
MSDNDLAAFFDEGWQHLSRGVADRRAPARHPTFATVSPEGLPEARTVVLRHASRALAFVDVHTDRRTPKVDALKAVPHAALHVWLPRAQMQMRLLTDVEILTGSEIDAVWERVPDGSRVSYGTQPVPGTPIPEGGAYEVNPDRACFAVLRCHLQRIELLRLGDAHRRALYRREDGWSGQWIAP